MLDFLVNSIRLSFLWTSWFIKLELCELDEYCRWREKGCPWAWLWDSLQDSFQEAFPMGFTPVSHVYGGSVAHDHKLREWSQTHLPGRGHFRGGGAITLKPSCLVYQLRGHKVTFLSFLHQPFFLLPGRVQICSPHCSSSYIFRVCSNVGASTTSFNHVVQRSVALAPPPLLPEVRCDLYNILQLVDMIFLNV